MFLRLRANEKPRFATPHIAVLIAKWLRTIFVGGHSVHPHLYVCYINGRMISSPTNTNCFDSNSAIFYSSKLQFFEPPVKMARKTLCLVWCAKQDNLRGICLYNTIKSFLRAFFQKSENLYLTNFSINLNLAHSNIKPQDFFCGFLVFIFSSIFDSTVCRVYQYTLNI